MSKVLTEEERESLREAARAMLETMTHDGEEWDDEHLRADLENDGYREVAIVHIRIASPEAVLRLLAERDALAAEVEALRARLAEGGAS